MEARQTRKRGSSDQFFWLHSPFKAQLLLNIQVADDQDNNLVEQQLQQILNAVPWRSAGGEMYLYLKKGDAVGSWHISTTNHSFRPPWDWSVYPAQFYAFWRYKEDLMNRIGEALRGRFIEESFHLVWKSSRRYGKPMS